MRWTRNEARMRKTRMQTKFYLENIKLINHFWDIWEQFSCNPLTFFFYWRYNPLWVCILQLSSGVIASSHTRFLEHTHRRATVSRTPLGEWSVRRRDFYLTTHSTHNRQTSMPQWDSNPWSQNASGRRPMP